jgi:hypothetical protein
VRWCCPPNHGCNAAGGPEICALELCRTAAGTDRRAALALERWAMLEQARDGQRRFRRRAYQRARDHALVALAFRSSAAAGATNHESAPAVSKREAAAANTDQPARPRRRLRRASRNGDPVSPREPESRVRSLEGGAAATPRRSRRR